MSRIDTIAAAHHTHPATPSAYAACVAAQAYLSRQPRRRSTDDVRAGDGPLYLLASGLVVDAQSRTGAGWICRVLNGTQDWSVAVTDIDVETAFAVSDPAAPLAGVDEAGYAIAWQARVCSRWPGPLVHHAARIMAEDLPRPQPRVVDFDPAAVRAFLAGLRLLRPPGLRQLLAKLSRSGLLTTAQPGDGDHWGRHRLSLPAVAGPSPDAKGRR
jgi:hypothetical protein